MSYLDVPRLHFFGSFFANPSTNNNNPDNYGLADQPNGPPDPPGFSAPLWNPDGSHTFMLGAPGPEGVVPCKVTGVRTEFGEQDDPILGAAVRCPNYALLVDLDTDQQWVSQIIGSTLRIEKGADVIMAKIPTVNFADIFFRVREGSSGNTSHRKDSQWSAAYQTVLTDVEWSDWPDSDFVRQLRDTTSPGTLSIRFVVDGFNTKNDSPLFRYGRLAGTIGPWHEGEPRTFVNARCLRPILPPPTVPPAPPLPMTPWGNFNYAPAKSREVPGGWVITIDLGNSIPTTWPDVNPPADFPTTVELPTVLAFIDSKPNPEILGKFKLTADAYRKNAFVQEFSTSQELFRSIGRAPFGIMVGGVRVLIENENGVYANFDQYAFRLNEGDTGVVDLWANRFEEPETGVVIPLKLGTVPTMDPDVNSKPPEAIRFPASVTTDAQGHARFEITAGNPGKPREFIDGQVYAVLQNWSEDKHPNPKVGVSVKIFQTVPIPEKPTWAIDVFPILNQFRWLYPVMANVVGIDLSDYDSVYRNRFAIRERIQLPSDNTGYMPITRELSSSKTAIILRWIDDGCPG